MKPADYIIIGKVLSLLPVQYRAFRTAWNMTAKDTATLKDLQSSLMSAEEDMKSSNSRTDDRGIAMKVKPFKKSGFKSKVKKTVTCFHCNKE